MNNNKIIKKKIKPAKIIKINIKKSLFEKLINNNFIYAIKEK